MCARFSLVAPVADIEAFLDARMPEEEAPVTPRANIAPTLDVPALVAPHEIRLLRWGLVPYWAEDPSIATRLINARAESAPEKPAFREAYRKRRCVIPANGFYEWREEEEPPNAPTLDLGFDSPAKGKTVKQPYYFHRSDGSLLALAGLWERWRGPDGRTLQTFTVLTTEPNATLAEFHDRMPCILERSEFAAWLDPEADDETLRALLSPAPDDAIAFAPADRRLNNVRFEPCSLA